MTQTTITIGTRVHRLAHTSLRGPPGPKGDQGDPGPKGDQGDPASVTPEAVQSALSADQAAGRAALALGTAAALDVPASGDAAPGEVVAGTDTRLSDAREWAADTVTQGEAEAGTDTARKAWSVLRVWQAIKKWALNATPISYTGGTNKIFYRLDGSALSANSKNFNFGVETFPGVNLPVDPRENSVVSIGWNVGSNGAREDVSQAMLRIAFEEHFRNPGNPAAFEWHLSSMDEAGVEHRPISCYLHKDGSPGSDLSFNADIIGLADYNFVQRAKANLLAGLVDVFGLVVRHDSNNTRVTQQKNAAGNDYIANWYVDGADMLHGEAPIVAVGPAPTTGPYADNFATLQCTALPNNGHGLSVITPGGNYVHNGVSVIGECQQALKLNVWNNSGVAAGAAVIELRTLGAAAGDPFIRYTINGVTDWAVGVDNSDDDAFVWSSWVPGAGNALRLSKDGDLALPKAGSGLRVKEGANCKQGVATLVSGTAIVSNTSITASSRIFLTSQSDGGTPGFLRVSARDVGASFTITSSSPSDTSTIAYQIFEPA